MLLEAGHALQIWPASGRVEYTFLADEARQLRLHGVLHRRLSRSIMFGSRLAHLSLTVYDSGLVEVSFISQGHRL